MLRRIAFALSFLPLLLRPSFAQQFTKLFDFGSDVTQGIIPLGNPVADKSGNLYGVTLGGGAPGTCQGGGCGVVFELSRGSNGQWTETVLHTFCEGGDKFDCPDGGLPNGLLIDSAGNLYGTTEDGGANNDAGVAFELLPPTQQGGAWTYTVIYNFCSISMCADGIAPFAGLTADSAGNLYGTTVNGGVTTFGGEGVVYKLTRGVTGWTESVLYTFCTLRDCADGYRPNSPVTFDQHGNLYGTTVYSSLGYPYCKTACGLLYKLTPGKNGWSETIVTEFPPIEGDHKDVIDPGAVTIDPLGDPYTTLAYGGNENGFLLGNGSVLRVRAKDNKKQAFLFDGSDGSNPNFILLDSTKRVLYGTSFGQGQNHFPGNVFQINQAGSESVLYEFCRLANCLDGLDPAGLYEDAAGNLFGFTLSGGAYSQGSGGFGTAFEIIKK